MISKEGNECAILKNITPGDEIVSKYPVSISTNFMSGIRSMIKCKLIYKWILEESIKVHHVGPR